MSEFKIPKEIQRKIFELTLALYRVTDFFPQGEPLRKHAREKANEIFGAVTEHDYSDLSEDSLAIILVKIQSMKGFLGIARSLRLVRPINLTILEREYDQLLKFFTQATEKPIPVPEVRHEVPKREELRTWNELVVEASEDNANFAVAGAEVKKVETPKQEGLSPISADLSERQQKIMEHLQAVNQAKISDFHSFFNDISSKTIQRDLQDLVSKNVLKKEGEKRWTVYSIYDNVQ